ncbi:hypothetical protein O6Y00_00010 [Sphingomonas faeni]
MTRFAAASEQVLVQAFITQASIEQLHDAVRLRLAGRDAIPFYAGVLAPDKNGVNVQFGLNTADYHAR